MALNQKVTSSVDRPSVGSSYVLLQACPWIYDVGLYNPVNLQVNKITFLLSIPGPLAIQDNITPL